MVGGRRFELPTSRSRTVRSSLAELHPGDSAAGKIIPSLPRFLQVRMVCRLAARRFSVKRGLCLRILMISALEGGALSGQGGAPSLYKTLAGYAQRGHEIDYVSATIGANHHHGA